MPSSASYLDSALESAEALLTIVNDILDLSRIDAGRLELAPVDVEIAVLPRSAAAAAGAQGTRSARIEFRCEALPEAPNSARFDPGRLRQVLLNLIGNALKFTTEGHVTLRVGPSPAPEGRVGCPSRSRIRAPASRRGPCAGCSRLSRRPAPTRLACSAAAGSGLMIAQRLTTRHGRRIARRQPRRPGHASFASSSHWSRHAVGIGRRWPRSRVPACWSSIRSRAAPTTMAEIATGWGLTVRTARSGRQALALLAEAADRGAPFDMVLVDRAVTRARARADRRRNPAEPRLRHARLGLLVASGIRGDAARAGLPVSPPISASRSRRETLLDCLRALRARHDGSERRLITVHSIGEHRPPPLRLLLADDNPVNCRLATIILERGGHKVDAVPDGLRAVEAASAASLRRSCSWTCRCR